MSATSLDKEWYHLTFRVKRSVRYNERRRLFFERWNRATSAIAVLFGSAAMASLMPSVGGDKWTAIAAFIVTLFSTFDLVVGTGRQAWLHADLTRRFIALEQMILNSTATLANKKKFSTICLDIEKDEPPVMHVLNLICHNELLLAEGHEGENRGNLYNIGPIRKMLANFIDIDHHSIVMLKDSSPL